MSVDKNAIKGVIKEDNEINPFEEKEEDFKPLRKDLLEQNNTKQLAKMVFDKKITSFQLSTLERTNKNVLVDYLLGIKKENNEAKSRHTAKNSDSDDMLDIVLSTLTSIKQSREKEAQINPIALNIFKGVAVEKIDNARASGAINSPILNNSLLAISAGAILIDTLIGFENIPDLFNKIKRKFSKNEPDTK